jgi:hypothetical protein
MGLLKALAFGTVARPRAIYLPFALLEVDPHEAV